MSPRSSFISRSAKLALMSGGAALAFALLHGVGETRVLAHGDDEISADDSDLDAPRVVSAETARFIGLKTVEPAQRSMAETVELTGRVKTPPESRRKVCARFGGRVVSIGKHVGDAAKSDDVVAVIESPEIARNQLEAHRSEAEIQRLLLEIEKVKVEAEALKRTVKVSELQNEAAKNELKRVEAQVGTGNLAALELANRQESVTRTSGDLRINTLQLNLADTTVANLTRQADAIRAVMKIQLAFGSSENGTLKVTADGTGTVTSCLVVPGEWVQSGQTLFELADRATVQIETDVPEALLPRVRVRKSDRAAIGVEGEPVIDGTAGALGASIHPVRRTATLYVSAPNAAGTLLDEARVTVTLGLSEPQNVLAIPRSAVLRRGPMRFVFVKNGEAFQKQEIETGRTDGQFVEVKAGLAPGDTIVSEGAEALLHLRR